MAKYIPKFDKDNKELLILDTIFSLDGCLQYAEKHNMNVLFTDTTSTSSVKAMMEFQKRGFNYKLYEKPSYAPDGMELDPEIFCLFEKYDKKLTDEIERIDRITINRWSSGSQGHGIDVMIESGDENKIIYKGSMELNEFAKCITAQASCKITTEIE